MQSEPFTYVAKEERASGGKGGEEGQAVLVASRYARLSGTVINAYDLGLLRGDLALALKHPAGLSTASPLVRGVLRVWTWLLAPGSVWGPQRGCGPAGRLAPARLHAACGIIARPGPGWHRRCGTRVVAVLRRPSSAGPVQDRAVTGVLRCLAQVVMPGVALHYSDDSSSAISAVLRHVMNNQEAMHEVRARVRA